MKLCKKCGAEKPLSDFHSSKDRKDGRHPTCKECCKVKQLKRKDQSREYYQEYNKDPDNTERRKVVQKKYKQSEYYIKNSKTWHNKGSAKYKERYPEKAKAQSILNNAIKLGKVKRGKCSVCGSENAHGHHEDYSKPLDVVWLCREHHMYLHKTALL